MNIREVLMIALILAIVAVSFIFRHCWTCAVDVLGRVLAQQMSSFNGMASIAAAIGRLNLPI